MPVSPRLRRLSAIALPAFIALVFTACSGAAYPNSVFTRFTDFNRDVGYLFKILFWLGTIVFIFVEALLLYTIFRYRRRSENDRPEHVHGNTTLEIAWTLIPAFILAFLAVPTVQVIFKTQARARADALQIEVIGHQWWWEFRYPQYTAMGANGKLDTLTTANELYLPIGRTANFSLRTRDVLHSFWIPQMGGKRDLISNHTNYLWYTPDSVSVQAWNGVCVEYCGASHANMRFKMFTVTPADFESWTRHQTSPAAFGAVMSAAPAVASTSPAVAVATTPPATTSPATTAPTTAMAAMPAHDMSAMPVQQAGYTFPSAQIPAHARPSTPIPPGMASFNESLVGDPEKGRDMLTKGTGLCLSCHMINGNPSMMGLIGPNLTHVASRSTIAGGIYPNDRKHLALWIKNARWMKPGVLMPTLGAYQRDPLEKKTVPATGLTDQQIADIVAYLQALK